MQTVYLLDTNIISELTAQTPNQQVLKKIFDTQKQAAISSVSWAQLLFDLNKLPEGKRKETLSDFYFNTIQPSYNFVDFDTHAAAVYSDIKSRLLQNHPQTEKLPSEKDLQLASVAIANNLILVTHNIQDFEPITENSMLMLDNWFEE